MGFIGRVVYSFCNAVRHVQCLSYENVHGQHTCWVECGTGFLQWVTVVLYNDGRDHASCIAGPLIHHLALFYPLGLGRGDMDQVFAYESEGEDSDTEDNVIKASDHVLLTASTEEVRSPGKQEH